MSKVETKKKYGVKTKIKPVYNFKLKLYTVSVINRLTCSHKQQESRNFFYGEEVCMFM